MRLLKNLYFLSAVIFFTFVSDRLFKGLVVISHKSFFVINNFLQISYHPNRGLALSLPASAYLIYPLVFLILTIIFYVLFLGWKKKDIMIIWAASLIFVGAVSNLIDRLRFGHVVDYINLTGWFPVFNLADVIIVTGVGLLIIKSIAQNRLTKPEK